MRITLNKGLSQELAKNLELSRYLGQVKQSLRYEAILLLSKGLSLECVAEFTQNSLRNIYNWVSLFLVFRVKGLLLKKSPGRPKKLTKTDKKKLKKMILSGPEKYGYDSGIWTSALIQDLIFKEFGVEYSTGYISQLLRQMGLSYKKCEAISHKADKEEQRYFMEKVFPEILIKAKRQNGVILFQDESTFRKWSRMGHSWGEKGKKLIAKVNMDSTIQKVVGAIELTSGEFIYKLTDKCNKETFFEYLLDVVEYYQDKKIFMFIDNGSIHDSAEIRRYLIENRDKIELVRFPTYSPMLNPIEKLWKKIKHNFMHNKFFAKKGDFISTLKNALKYYQDNCWEVHLAMKKLFNISMKIEADFEQKFRHINTLKAC